MTKLKIKVTKEILKKTKHCTKDYAYANCAIAESVRDLFPMAAVMRDVIYVHVKDVGNLFAPVIILPPAASDFIECFDLNTPKERLEMEPIEFEVEVPDRFLESINIDEIRQLLINHPTLELC